MDVEQTKALILRELAAMRDRQQRAAAQASAAPPSAPPPSSSPPPRAKPRPRRTRRFSLFSGGKRAPAGELETRLHRLEERLYAVERLLVAGTGPTRLAGESAAGRGPRLVRGEGGGLGGPPPSASASPSSPAALANSGEEESSYRLTGGVDDGLMTDVLQMLASNRKTGRFSLFLDSREDRFDLFFLDGELVHARAGDLTGEAAFFALMTTGHEEGRYGFVEEERGAGETTIDAQTHFLILEALRRIDEGADGGEGGAGEEEGAG